MSNFFLLPVLVLSAARACSLLPSPDLKLAKWLKFRCTKAYITIPLENPSMAACWILEWYDSCNLMGDRRFNFH